VAPCQKKARRFLKGAIAMTPQSYLARRFFRLTLTVLATACLAAWCSGFPPAQAEAGSLVIPAWSFARGNVQIHADPNRYADAGPVVVSGPRQPWGWSVEYDIEVPVSGKYTVQICYASAESRPMEMFFDGDNLGRCCDSVTFSPSTAGKPAEPTFNSSGARWVGFYTERFYTFKPIELHVLSLEKGTHTLKLFSRDPLPHLAAVRLDTPEEFPKDWKEPNYEARDMEAVPAAHRSALLSGEVSPAIRQLPIEQVRITRPSRSLMIPAWTFDRGNANIYASPDQYADCGPMVGGPEKAEVGAVEYDIEFPADGEYTVIVSYASIEARPVDVYLDERNMGKCCTGVAYGSAAFEQPIRTTANSHGAEWRQEGLIKDGKLLAMSVTKGKHTLKLSRSGPLPNLAHLRLESSAAFPNDWKQPERELRHPDRVPAPQLAAFLPPDVVNVAALRLAFRDTMETHGSQYPDGSKYLVQLSSLEARQTAAKTGTDEQKRKIEDELAALRSRAMMAHPAMNFEHLLFLKRPQNIYGHTYSDQNANSMGGSLCALSPVAPGGKITPLVPELEGGLFDRFDLSFDGTKVAFGYKKQDGAFRIHEIDIDPKTGKMAPGSLRQLTFGCDEEGEALQCNASVGRGTDRGFNDMDPCYLPDGRIMFTSTRSRRNVFCAGSTVTTLYVMDADGKNVKCLSSSPLNESAPSVLEDGRVIYTRWEYVDKGLGNGQSLWAIRPDGSGSDHVYKNNTIRPAGMSTARSIPGSRKFVTIGGTHHLTAVGPVILVDTRRSRRGTGAMTCITPELGYPGMSFPTSKFGFFMEPYPLSEKFFLVSHVPGSLGRAHHNAGNGYGLYVLDAWGNRAELYGDPELGCHQPIPLLPRRKPATLAAIAAKHATVASANPEAAEQRPTGTLYIQDVYQGMTGIERGRVKYLRVMGVLPWPWGQRGMFRLGMNADVHRKKVFGVVEVHEDGSVYFTAPAEENILFQALDENYMLLQHMATFINLMPGEQRSCIGCHEPRRNAPGAAGAPSMALQSPPQTPMPQPGDTGPRMVHYATDVQPILDRHCVACHGEESPKGRLDLAGTPTAAWNTSYENILKGGLVSYRDGRCGRAGFRAVPPLTHGSHPSKLTDQIQKDPCKANLSREEFIKIVTWIDANVPYYGTYRGKRDLKDRDHPDFRPAPLAGK